MDQPFSYNRYFRAIPLGVRIVQARLPLVSIGGGRSLREPYFDAHSQLERDSRTGMSGPDHAYAMAMMGGEPYANWH